jgi:tetratricopeptide (TPR) repeat protein
VLPSSRIRVQKILSEAEGYVELCQLFGDDFDTTLAKKLVLPRAIAALEQISRLGSHRSRTLWLHGEALRTLERYADAIEPLRAASELDSDNIHIWLALGWCYKRTGRLDLAIEALEQALERDHGGGIVPYNLACYWSLAGNKERALEFLSQALAIHPDYRDMVGKERDFDPLRSDPDFQSLVSVIV